MKIPLDEACEYIRKWADLPLTDLRALAARRMGDKSSTYRKHSRGDLLALLLSNYPQCDARAPVCTR